MITNFKQGIINTQENFLSLIGNNVSLNCDINSTIITFSHGKSNYLFQESVSIPNAWTGNWISGINYWLYWDIDLYSGIRTFNYTTSDPTNYGGSYPSNPAVDQHFFNTKEKLMKVWTGSKWREVLRVFAGKISSGGILIANNIGSQVGLQESGTSGFLLFTNNGMAIKANDKFGKGEFITTETFLLAQNDSYNSYKIQKENYAFKSNETIPKFSCVAIKNGYIGIASSEFPEFPCVGITHESIKKGEIKQFINNGILYNADWNFTEPPGTAIWVNQTGEVTATMSQKTSIQKIGHVVNNNTIFIDIKDVTLIDPN